MIIFRINHFLLDQMTAYLLDLLNLRSCCTWCLILDKIGFWSLGCVSLFSGVLCDLILPILIYFHLLFLFFLLKFQFFQLFFFKEVELDLPVETRAVFYQDVSEVYQNADDY